MKKNRPTDISSQIAEVMKCPPVIASYHTILLLFLQKDNKPFWIDLVKIDRK